MSDSSRLILLIASITLTIILFLIDIVSFAKYTKRGNYQYENINNKTYMVVKEGFNIDFCPENGTRYSYGEVDWLIKRSKGHYFFLFCFWGAFIMAFIISIFGSILEHVCRQNINCCDKFLRILRSTLYKSSISIPVAVLFAFDYTKPCLQLKKTTFMLFSNEFAYVTVAIQFPVLIIVFIDVILEFYTRKPYATYKLIRDSIQEDQPTCKKILRVVFYSVLSIITISGILLSFVIYLELLFVINSTHLLLVLFNVLLSIFNIVDTL
jgi:hypothetical protein